MDDARCVGWCPYDHEMGKISLIVACKGLEGKRRRD